MTLQTKRLEISENIGVIEFRPPKFDDERGFFSETYNKQKFTEFGIDIDFVQDNHSLSVETGTVRGLHFQCPPFAQAKLVRAVSGAIFDVAVDIRAGSPTFGQHVSAIIDAEKWNQIFVPEGFAHGFCTLKPNTEIIYKVSAPYSKDHDFGVLWSDPKLAIDWPVSEDNAIVSSKDKVQPGLDALPRYFTYGGPDC